MKKSQINPEDLLNDLNNILNNIKLLEDENISPEKLEKIQIKINKENKLIKNKYKNLDSPK